MASAFIAVGSIKVMFKLVKALESVNRSYILDATKSNTWTFEIPSEEENNGSN